MERAWFFAYALVVYVPVILLLGIYVYMNEKPQNYKPIHNVQRPVQTQPTVKPVQTQPTVKPVQSSVITQGNSVVYSYSKNYPIFDDYYKNQARQQASNAELNR